MTISELSQEELDRVAKELAPDVVYMRATIGPDWTGDPSIHFRVVLSDTVGLERVGEVAQHVRSKVLAEFRRFEQDLIPYFDFRELSEPQLRDDAEWL